MLGMAVALPGVSFGALSVAGGLPTWAPIAMSVLVFAGGAQFAAVGVLTAGAGALPAILTGLLLNLRLLPYGLTMSGTVAPVGDGPDPGESGGSAGRDPRRARVVGRWLLPHLVVDESVGLAQTRRDPVERRAAFLCGGWGVFLGWNLGVLVGIAVGQIVGDPAQLGLDAALPAVLAALIVGAVRSSQDGPTASGPAGPDGGARAPSGPEVDHRLVLAALTGGVIGVGAHGLLPPGLDVVAGLAGGLVVLLPGRRTGTPDVAAGRS